MLDKIECVYTDRTDENRINGKVSLLMTLIRITNCGHFSNLVKQATNDRIAEKRKTMERTDARETGQGTIE